jgi:hypothetical protein
MEAVCSSETLISTCQATRCHYTEEHNINENIKGETNYKIQQGFECKSISLKSAEERLIPEFIPPPQPLRT